MSLTDATTVYIVTACFYSAMYCLGSFRISYVLAKYRSQNVKDSIVLFTILLGYVVAIMFVITTISSFVSGIDIEDMTRTARFVAVGLVFLPMLLQLLSYFYFVHLNRVRKEIKSQ